jgi:hypothetical protein
MVTDVPEPRSALSYLWEWGWEYWIKPHLVWLLAVMVAATGLSLFRPMLSSLPVMVADSLAALTPMIQLGGWAGYRGWWFPRGSWVPPIACTYLLYRWFHRVFFTGMGWEYELKYSFMRGSADEGTGLWVGTAPLVFYLSYWFASVLFRFQHREAGTSTPSLQ